LLKLIVMRHAKSDWETGAQTDHERPLNERGNREAPSVGRQLRDLGLIPDFVLSSDSQRTTETYQRIGSFFPDAQVHFRRELYHAGIAEVRALLDLVPAGTQTLLLVGHNPGWEELATTLAKKRVEMKTAYAAVFESEAADFTSALAPGAPISFVRVVTP
jgi:phosphohistidine phosphatase